MCEWVNVFYLSKKMSVLIVHLLQIFPIRTSLKICCLVKNSVLGTELCRKLSLTNYFKEKNIGQDAKCFNHLVITSLVKLLNFD